MNTYEEIVANLDNISRSNLEEMLDTYSLNKDQLVALISDTGYTIDFILTMSENPEYIEQMFGPYKFKEETNQPVRKTKSRLIREESKKNKEEIKEEPKKEDNKEEVTIKETKEKPKKSSVVPENVVGMKIVNLGDVEQLLIDTNASQMAAFNNYRTSMNKFKSNTFSVILPVSGLQLRMRGLTASEVDYLRNSILSKREASDTIKEIAYNCISAIEGMPKFSLKEFLTNVAVIDYEIILYGIIRSTYGQLTDINLYCDHCKKNFDATIITDSLITVTKDKSKELVSLIADGDRISNYENSVFHTFNKRIMLDESKIVIEVGFPSIDRDREMVERLNPKDDSESQSRRFIIASMTKVLYLPQFEQISETELAIKSYYPIKSPVEIYKILDNATTRDLDDCVIQVNEIADDYTIDFRLKNIRCTHCNSEINDAKVDLGMLFFQAIMGKN